MTNPQAPTTAAEAHGQMVEALNNLVGAFETLAEDALTDPILMGSAGEFIRSLAEDVPDIILDIIGIASCGAALVGDDV
ncbi:hypothetical protein KIH27_10715 [Mycobacterium sp. M1]|uniref:Uncharacterized protein n=1 Tax=Mycolicibacter acidiphilus TaxID=2835306 RepID=A0ABS5RID3_9MYCO|nr:hypothetical protein [Mycolicibacter acidiphilus]MBS9534055.1 hypothetical protein [Mycolicibacter acidiphilus]